jgi:DnaK suppressor protein
MATKKGTKPAKKTQAKAKKSEPKAKKSISKTKEAKKPTAKAKKPALKAKKPTLSGSRKAKIEEIRRKLQKQKEAILSEAEAAMNAMPEQTIFPDLGDQASVECDMSFMLRLRGREQRLLKKIDEALSRIEEGTFGICDVCGEEIDINRLIARPVTTMCIHCKTEQEAEEKIMGG